MNFKEFYLHKPFKSSLLFLATALSSLLLVGSSYALTLEFNALRSRQALLFAPMLGLQLACLLFSALLTYYSNLTLEKLIQSYLQQIRQDVALHLFNDAKAHDPAQAQNQLLKEEDLLSVNYLRNIYSAFKSGVTVLAAGGALLSFHWSLFIACLIFALMQIYLPRLLDRQLNQANQKLAAQNQAYLKVLGDWLLGLGDLHRCLSLAWFKEKAGLAAKKLEDAHVHKSAVSTRLDYLNQLAY